MSSSSSKDELSSLNDLGRQLIKIIMENDLVKRMFLSPTSTKVNADSNNCNEEEKKNVGITALLELFTDVCAPTSLIDDHPDEGDQDQ